MLYKDYKVKRETVRKHRLFIFGVSQNQILRPLALHQRVLVLAATSQRHLLKTKKDTLQGNKLKDFECHSTTDCGIPAYYLLSPNI